ncbi:MAG: imidazole glycerol phosphate synthase subunit HisH [Polaribacter sp.]
MIAIIDYKVGNLGSIENMLKKLGVEAIITNNIQEIEAAHKLILPGVGAFDEGMKKLKESGLIPTLDKMVKEDKKPILGICLGMQLMTKKSEEGSLSGLGWIDAEVIKFNLNDTSFKVPHMGWNYVNPVKENNLIQTEEHARFYFVHSYYVKCNKSEHILAKSHHGIEFVSVFQSDNIIGIQSHPEKSHKYGLSFLKKFKDL